MKQLKLLFVAMIAFVVAVGCSTGTDADTEVNDEGKLTEAHEAVKNVFGEAYLPDMSMEPQMLEEIYGVKQADVKNVIAEGPMISMHPDVFIGVEAAEGKVDDVEAALLAYKNNDIEQGMHYPQNLAKVKATEVIKIRNHVFLVRVGAINENMDATEAEADEFAKAEVQKAVDAINEVFGVK